MDLGRRISFGRYFIPKKSYEWVFFSILVYDFISAISRAVADYDPHGGFDGLRNDRLDRKVNKFLFVASRCHEYVCFTTILHLQCRASADRLNNKILSSRFYYRLVST